MKTINLKELRNALSCWQDDYDCDDDKEQYDMFGAAIDAVSRLEAAELEIEGLKRFQELNLKIKQAMHERFTRAERERDELRAEQAEHDEQIARMESKFSLAKRALDSKTARCDKAEAELRRRDAGAGELPSDELSRLREWVKCVEAERDKAISWHSSLLKKHDKLQADIERCDTAAGEPVAWQYRYNDGKVGDWKTVDSESECNHSPCYERRAIYTAAPPAVLPPDITFESKGFVSLTSEDFAYNRALEDARKLGAQEQKVVELPDRKFRECVNGLLEEAIAYAGTQQLRARLSSRLSNFVKTQRATGVKWEVKK